MNEDYGNDFITLIDEDGIEAEYEHIDTLEYNGGTYFALVKAEPTNEELLQGEDMLLILKLSLDDNGDQILATIEDDDEYDEVSLLFENNLEDYYEIEH